MQVNQTVFRKTFGTINGVPDLFDLIYQFKMEINPVFPEIRFVQIIEIAQFPIARHYDDAIRIHFPVKSVQELVPIRFCPDLNFKILVVFDNAIVHSLDQHVDFVQYNDQRFTRGWRDSDVQFGKCITGTRRIESVDQMRLWIVLHHVFAQQKTQHRFARIGVSGQQDDAIIVALVMGFYLVDNFELFWSRIERRSSYLSDIVWRIPETAVLFPNIDLALVFFRSDLVDLPLVLPSRHQQVQLTIGWLVIFTGMQIPDVPFTDDPHVRFSVRPDWCHFHVFQKFLQFVPRNFVPAHPEQRQRDNPQAPHDSHRWTNYQHQHRKQHRVFW